MGARKPKKREIRNFQELINRSPARRMLRQSEMEMDTQAKAKDLGVSTDEESIRRAKEKRRKR